MDSKTTICVNRQASEVLDAQAHIWNHIFSYLNSMALKCAIELGIPNAIHKHGQPITLPQLAIALHIHPTKVSSLNRLMRLLVHSNFFTRKLINGEFMFDLTLNSKLLLNDHPLSLAPFVLEVLDPIMVDPAQSISIWLKNDSESPFHVVHGRSIWEHAGIVPEFNELFNNSMTSDARFVAKLLTTNDKFEGLFEGVKSLVDVGGGSGTMAKVIAEACNGLKCIVLDLPHVVEGLQGSKSGVVYIGGDMFEEVPRAQVALLKFILHDWSDEHCVQILRKCKEAIPSKDEGGKVIIIDIMIEDSNGIDYNQKYSTSQLLFDMHMMTICFGGRERTKEEWRQLFLQAGFGGDFKVLSILGPRSVIEIYPS